MLVIAAIRLAGSLPVLRWPFTGGLLALLTDQSDLLLMNLLDLGGVTNYQAFDKYLDQVYLAAFLAVALRWNGLSRDVAIGLYVYRALGFILFEVSQERALLLFFPNLFEFWFILVAGLRQVGDEQRLTSRPVLALLGVLAALKLFQEYALHQARWLDDFTTVEAIEAVWRWLTAPFG